MIDSAILVSEWLKNYIYAIIWAPILLVIGLLAALILYRNKRSTIEVNAAEVYETQLGTLEQ